MDKMTGDMIFKGVSGYPDQTLECVPDLADMSTLTGTAAGTWVSGYGVATILLAAASNTKRRKIVGALVGLFGHAGIQAQIKIAQGTTTKAVFPVFNKTLVGNEQFVAFPQPCVIEAGYDINGYIATNSGNAGETVVIKLLAVPL